MATSLNVKACGMSLMHSGSALLLFWIRIPAGSQSMPGEYRTDCAPRQDPGSCAIPLTSNTASLNPHAPQMPPYRPEDTQPRSPHPLQRPLLFKHGQAARPCPTATYISGSRQTQPRSGVLNVHACGVLTLQRD